MESNGFANCPSVKEFKNGMEIRRCSDNNGWAVVCHVTDNGWAQLAGRGHFVEPSDITEHDLNLDSIWEGREYNSKRNPSAIATIRVVGEYHVGYQIGECTHFCCVNKELFLGSWTPLLLRPPAEETEKCEGCEKPAVTHDNDGVPLCQQCADQLRAEGQVPVAPEPVQEWKPARNKDAVYAGRRVFVRDVYRKHAWIVSPDQCEYPGSIVLTKLLSPLPPEPPVKVGEYVVVQTKSGKEHVGKVISVEPEDRHFLIHDGDGQRGLLWDDGSKITRLVPAIAGQESK